jgi:hypothetical protein
LAANSSVGKRLDRDLSAKHGVLGQINYAHTAFTKFA